MRLTTICCAVLLTTCAASAQISDGVGLYVAEDDLTDYGQAGEGIHTVYLVLTDPSVASGVYAWELALALVGPGLLMPGDFEGNSVNYASFPELSVGVGGGLPSSAAAVLLSTVQVMILGQNEPVELTIGPVSNPPGGSLGNDLPVYVTWDGDQNYPMQNMYPSSGDIDEPVFVFNDSLQGPPQSETWSGVKAVYRD